MDKPLGHLIEKNQGQPQMEDPNVNAISTLEHVQDSLEKNGYPVARENGCVMVQVGGTDSPFTAVLGINPDNRELMITCKLADIGDFDDDNIAAMALAALDINTCIRPYALAIISDTDDPDLDDEHRWPLVLTDSLALGDLCEDELAASMDALIQAIVTSRSVLEIGLGQ